MRAGLKGVVGLGLLVGCVASSARGAIGYDAITGQTPVGWLHFGSTEVAEDTTLDPTAGLTVTGAVLRLWNSSFTGNVNATVRVSVYQATGGMPGALLTTGTIALMMPTNSMTDLLVDLPDVTLAGSGGGAVWTSYQFTPLEQPAIYPGVAVTGAPSVGTTASGYAFFTAGAWSAGGSNQSLGMQVRTVPGVGGVVGVGMLGVVGATLRGGRRRGARRG